MVRRLELDTQCISAELSVLINLFGARARPDPASIFCSKPSRPLDWRRLIALADQHSLYPQLCEAVVEFGQSVCPPQIKSELKDGRRQRGVVNRAMEARLVELCDTMREAGVSIVAFKGPVLDQLLYKGRYLRQYSDLDLLARADQVASAVRILRSSGYVSEVDVLDPTSHPLFLSNSETSFTSPTGFSTDVDLHWRLLESNRPTCTSLLGFEQRLQDVHLSGRPVRTLGDIDLLVYLCHHFSKHDGQNLAQLYDIANQLQRISGADWDTVLQQARADGLDRALLLGPYLAAALLGARIPEQLLAAATSMQIVHTLGHRLLPTLELPAIPGATNGSLCNELWPSLSAKARRLAYTIFAPQVADWRFLPLRPEWSFLYFGIRPARLLLREIGRVARR